MSARLPDHVQVLVIGGGPSGSYAAAALAREGVNVVLFEATKFPRYHIGESLIPSVRHYLRFIDAEDKLANYGFMHKPGAAIKFTQFKREGYTDFVALGHSNSSWNVIRSEFDAMLLEHARSCGAIVFESTRVERLEFAAHDESKPVAVHWIQKNTDDRKTSGRTEFDYLIDATGRAGMISTRHLKNRHFNSSLKNIALWGYWRDVNQYGKGTSRQGAPWFEALTDQTGWAWFIPLHDGTTSVGIVMNRDDYERKLKASDSSLSLEERYRSFLRLAPGLIKLISDGKLVANNVDSRGEVHGLVRSASDFSYSARDYAGPHFRLVGDAAAFIDPFFSSGVHLALTSALSAAATICAALRGDCSEAKAACWHTRRVSVSYTRFQIVVLSAYKQFRAQSMDILSDINEDNYDRAFETIRPVIQGASDMGARLSERELQDSLDFCIKLFNPTSPEQQGLAVERGLGKGLLDVTAPVMDPCELREVLLMHEKSREKEGNTDEGWDGARETALVAEQVNARRVVQREYAIHNLECEELDGYRMRLCRGKLGLKNN